MLAIRMQRTGRKGHAQFRVIVQDSRFSPASGRVVEYLGSYDPHAKTAKLDKDKIAGYLSNGAHPSDRTAQLFKAEGIKLPEWVKTASPKTRSIRHPDKLRRNRPPGESPTDSTGQATGESQPEIPAEEAAAEPAEPAETAEVPAESQTPEEQPAQEETPAETETGNEPAEPASEEAIADSAETTNASEESEAEAAGEETS